jgi:hypothetical protein
MLTCNAYSVDVQAAARASGRLLRATYVIAMAMTADVLRTCAARRQRDEQCKGNYGQAGDGEFRFHAGLSRGVS